MSTRIASAGDISIGARYDVRPSQIKSGFSNSITGRPTMASENYGCYPTQTRRVDVSNNDSGVGLPK